MCFFFYQNSECLHPGFAFIRVRIEIHDKAVSRCLIPPSKLFLFKTFCRLVGRVSMKEAKVHSLYEHYYEELFITLDRQTDR